MDAYCSRVTSRNKKLQMLVTKDVKNMEAPPTLQAAMAMIHVVTASQP
jgi:hypothetical protein